LHGISVCECISILNGNKQCIYEYFESNSE
jgi:hypothetical protein